MSAKKRKSDINIDSCELENESDRRKDKPWFEEQTVTDGSNRRKSFFGGMFKFKKMKSSSTLKDKNTLVPGLDSIMSHNNDITHLSQTSESSATSIDSSNVSLLPNVGKNADLRTFVNRNPYTASAPECPKLNGAGLNPHSDGKPEDNISISSRMSVDTIGSNQTMEEDRQSVSSTSMFCTPLRAPLRRNGAARISTRSVPDRHYDDPAYRTFNSVCNSVKRVPSSVSEKSFTPNSAARRSMRHMSRKLINSFNMEDVPEDEALTTVSRTFSTTMDEELEEEKFVDGKEFFANNVIQATESESNDRESISSNARLSVSSESRKNLGSSSIGRSNSILKKLMGGISGKERRNSEVHQDEFEIQNNTSSRRASNVSFSAESTSISNGSASNGLGPKMRSKTASASNITHRFSLSNMFRRTKDDDSQFTGQPNRRSTLTGYSSQSSGIGSIASINSDVAYNMPRLNGTSISRNGSKREDEVRKERYRRFLRCISIAKEPAVELIRKMKESKAKKKQKEIEEQYETQLNDSGSTIASQNSDIVKFDVISVDVQHDGKPVSAAAKEVVDSEMAKRILNEISNSYRSDICGTLIETDPDVIFVCPQPTATFTRDLNDSIASTGDLHPTLLPNVRNGVSKSIELWSTAAGTREESTMLLFPMFCTSELEWDAPETIDGIFKMLDTYIHTKRWKTNGKVLLAGLTENNTRLLQEKYDAMKLFLQEDEDKTATDDAQSLNSSVIYTNV
ncbi:unnamed protein product [Caenorhabditis bovis]|uniref:Uncharacterized protein n=1 Tax=Caenorhabditis bovis TaxID=2654633 RepID=A0A8S1EFI2_9PELO|nr:unnamed protein product [Caenorhabditis bovis]